MEIINLIKDQRKKGVLTEKEKEYLICHDCPFEVKITGKDVMIADDHLNEMDARMERGE